MERNDVISIQRVVRRAARAGDSTVRLVTQLAWRPYLQHMEARYGLPTADLGDLRVANPSNVVKPHVMDEICLPPYYGPADHDDYHPLIAVVSGLRPDIVLELGTAHGNTVANICAVSPTASVYSVNAPADIQTGNVVTFSLEEKDIGRVYRAQGYSSRVCQILGNTMTLDFTESIPAGRVDLAIIDACHDTKYVLNDFKKVLPLLSDHGVVLLHDTHPSMELHLRGSYLACLLLRRQGYDIRHLRNTWWGVWRRDGWG